MRAFRIADRRFPIFDGTGARLLGGRWNSPGRGGIYCADTYAGALLEVLVHGNLGRVPKSHAFVEISIPDGLRVDVVALETVPGWDAENQIASRKFGDQWLVEQRTAVLLVPSIVTPGRGQNILLNPHHPDFARITASEPQQLAWDQRSSPAGNNPWRTLQRVSWRSHDRPRVSGDYQGRGGVGLLGVPYAAPPVHGSGPRGAR